MLQFKKHDNSRLKSVHSQKWTFLKLYLPPPLVEKKIFIKKTCQSMRIETFTIEGWQPYKQYTHIHLKNTTFLVFYQ